MSGDGLIKDPLRIIPCDDLDAGIDHYINQLGYRLDMIKPADAPREALVSKDGETILLEKSTPPAAVGVPTGPPIGWSVGPGWNTAI